MNALQKAAFLREGRMTAMMVRAADSGKRAMKTGELVKGFRDHNRWFIETEIAAAERAYTKALEAGFPDLLMSTLRGGADVAASKLPRIRVARKKTASSIGIAFDQTNEQAVIWIEQHAAELVQDVTRETRAALREMMRISFTEGIPPRQAAIMIRGVVGLTEVQAAAVARLRKTLLESSGKRVIAGKTPIRVPTTGMPADKLDRALTAYHQRLAKQRALVIARTETIRASNEGQRQLWQQAVQRGDLPAGIKRVWLVSDPCPICRPYANAVAKLDEPFLGSLMNPPAHPQCKCTTGLA
jgi:hypothetical protein